MAEYYAVERSPEYLMHYGVKGMRWGVQRAKERGNERALARHWGRAQKKLKKLKDRTDINKQKKLYIENKANAIANGIVAPIDIGLGFLGTHLSKNAAADRIRKKVDAVSGIPGYHYISDTYRDYRPYGIAMGTLNAGAAIGRGIMAKKAKNRTTTEGHRQAVRDVNDWQREMNRAFAGTKYGKKRRRG